MRIEEITDDKKEILDDMNPNSSSNGLDKDLICLRSNDPVLASELANIQPTVVHIPNLNVSLMNLQWELKIRLLKKQKR